MKTVNSLSGGKTSSYLAANYPADVDIFALVCNDDNRCRIKDDGIMKIVNDKLEKYTPYYGEVIGIAENPDSVLAVIELEQYIGREIVWVRDVSYDEIVRQRMAIPNRQKRFCTTILKIRPIFHYCRYMMSQEIVSMRTGIRYDEAERAERLTTTWDNASFANFYPASAIKGDRWENQWTKDVEWRVNENVLVDDKIITYNINEYWDGKGIAFPKDSNCPYCFWKPHPQLRQNWDDYPGQMQWAADMEAVMGYTFKDDMTMEEIKKLNKQLFLDFGFGTGSGCQAGFCTD